MFCTNLSQNWSETPGNFSASLTLKPLCGYRFVQNICIIASNRLSRGCQMISNACKLWLNELPGPDVFVGSDQQSCCICTAVRILSLLQFVNFNSNPVDSLIDSRSPMLPRVTRQSSATVRQAARSALVADDLKRLSVRSLFVARFYNTLAKAKLPPARNEPMLNYAPGSPGLSLFVIWRLTLLILGPLCSSLTWLQNAKRWRMRLPRCENKRRSKFPVWLEAKVNLIVP